MTQLGLMPASWNAPGGLEADDELRDVERPRTRAECPPRNEQGERWCPWVGCRHHCALHVRVSGEIQPWREERDAGRPRATQARWRGRDAEQVAQDEAVDAIGHLVERHGSPCSLDLAEAGPTVELNEIGRRLACGEWSAHRAWQSGMHEVEEELEVDTMTAAAALAEAGRRSREG